MSDRFNFKTIIDDEVSRLILAYIEGKEDRDLPKTMAALDLLCKITIASALHGSDS